MVAVLVLCCGAIALFTLPSKSVNATVDAVHWQTVANVEEIEAVRHNDETGSVPSGAYDVSCNDESREVCEEKTIDTGPVTPRSWRNATPRRPRTAPTPWTSGQ